MRAVRKPGKSVCRRSAFGTISASDSRLSQDGFYFTLSPEDVDVKVTFMCELITD
jgi:hypothetical protein